MRRPLSDSEVGVTYAIGTSPICNLRLRENARFHGSGSGADAEALRYAAFLAATFFAAGTLGARGSNSKLTLPSFLSKAR